MNRNIYHNLFRTRLLSALVVFTLLATFFAKASQQHISFAAENGQTGKVIIVGGSGASCNLWRGKITYLSNTSGSSESEVPVYGKDYGIYMSKISGEITLDGANKTGKVSVDYKSKVETIGQQKACCWMNLAGCQKETIAKWNYTKINSGSGVGEGKVDGDVIVTGGRYKIKFRLPDVQGKDTMKNSRVTSGYCNPEDNKSVSGEPVVSDLRLSPIQVQAEGTIDPKNPNVLQGSFQPDKDTTITWNLTKVAGNKKDCAGDLAVSNLKLEHHVFPNRDEWKKIEKNTVDGNRVRITAMVSNGADEPKSGTLTFREIISGEVIDSMTVVVPAGGEMPVEALWDTSGFAWSDLGEKMSNRTIEASLSNGDKAEASVAIYPKPVILVHGLWSNAASWNEYHKYLTEAHSRDWKSFAVGADPAHGIMNTGDRFGNFVKTNTIAQNAEELGKQIKYAHESTNAWHVDIVAHSMGGLISRYYIHELMKTDSPDKKPYVSHLVMLGTPNLGSPCADIMYTAGATVLGKPVEALRQLKPSVIHEFNKVVTNRKGVRFSILSGFPFPRTCQDAIPGDGVVTVDSAIMWWKIKDREYVPRIHTDLTGKQDFESFVKPRLALGPKKVKQEQTAALFQSQVNENWLASLNPVFAPDISEQPNEPNVQAVKFVKIAPEDKTEVSINFPSNSNSGITFIAPEGVSLTLVRETEEETEQIQTEQESGLFRTLYLEGRSGSWTLRFENSSDRPEEAMFVVWNEPGKSASLVILNAESEDGTRIFIQAKLVNNGLPLGGAKMTAKVSTPEGKTVTAQLFDDGKHDDQEAGDGVYGGRTANDLSSGDYSIEVQAANQTAAAFVNIPK